MFFIRVTDLLYKRFVNIIVGPIRMCYKKLCRMKIQSLIWMKILKKLYVHLTLVVKEKCFNIWNTVKPDHNYIYYRGGSSGGHTRRAPPPLKLENIWFFGINSWFFTWNTPKMFAPPSAIGKNTIFCRKIVIFHTKYPKFPIISQFHSYPTLNRCPKRP